MATGRDFGYEDPDLDNMLDDDDVDDDDEQEVDRTQPFQPGASSTPYHGGEQVVMQTMQHEHSGLPGTSYQEETPQLERTPSISDLQKESIFRRKLKKFFDLLKAKNLEFDIEKNPVRRGRVRGKNEGKIVAVGPRGGEYKILKDDGSDFTKSFLEAFKDQLRPRAEEIIAEDRDTIGEEIQRQKETEKQLKQAEDLVANKEQLVQDIQEVARKKERSRAQLDAIHDEHGSNLEIEAEVRRLEQLIKNYETEEKNMKKELASVSKNVKKKQELVAKANRQRENIAEKEREKNAMQEKLNQTKTMDDVKEQISEMQRQKAEYEAVIQDENASPSDIQAAQDGLADINERLPPLQTQIAEMERARPLLERVKEIFKKYGLTVTSVLLAAGITIGAVVSTITNALKASTKALGKGLKDIGAKLGSLLPGLIGSIANFLFKAAGQAIGFLAGHTWLLILAVVAFLFEKNLKKRR